MIAENRTLHTASTGKTHRRAAPASADPTPETPVQAELASLPTDARSAAPAVPATEASAGLSTDSASPLPDVSLPDAACTCLLYTSPSPRDA